MALYESSIMPEVNFQTSELPHSIAFEKLVSLVNLDKVFTFMLHDALILVP